MRQVLHPIQNAVYYIDEAYSWLESRISGAYLNRELSYKLNFQKRKSFLDVYLTEPLLSSIDKRFRIKTDITIMCQPREPKFYEDFIYYYYRKNRPNKIVEIKRIKYEVMEKYFDLYDTKQIIEPYKADYSEFKIISQDPKLLKEKIYELYDIIKPQVPDYKKMTHEDLNTYLIDNEIVLNYSKWLYPLIKRNVEIKV